MPVLQRFEDMRRLDIFFSGEIGDRARELDDAVIRARGELQFLGALIQNIFCFD